ncbi:LacI family DNA-binding transcriptional regulator [Acanthopleuribacter pedis]|uniref:LacI family DNA-binding transcriptional regulator n=1 Tax=Acanthopleuribacter pedis TaxID=442870 RepID=A0A8J7QBN0_9BACT|nr:LacI family DNA-binding transcriptional regulator [Acanthopleuribacter pedis]MBO1322621.1 LacI family DNA-binding transcriptional regulator [Acanthopleuribacter pedis]
MNDLFPANQGKKATIDDVAALAKVSIKTVSRVFNAEPNVRPTTRDRVMAAARELDYQPNLSARRLAAKRAFVIGLLYDNPQSDYIIAIQEGALQICRQYGYHILIHPCTEEPAGLVSEAVNLKSQGMVDGFLLSQPISENAALIQALEQRNIPHVRISQRALGGAPCISVNDEEAAARMTQHLIELGHTRIGFVMGHPDHGSSHDRHDGFQRAMAAAGLTVNPDWVEQGLYNFESGYSAGRRLLAAALRPTAIFACNDHMAMGVLTAAHEQGVTVPGQLSVCGFDDTPMARYSWPPLTTSRQPIHQVALLAAEVLLKRIRNEAGGDQSHLLHCELVRRASTGSAPG